MPEPRRPRPEYSFSKEPPAEVSAYFRQKQLRPAFRWTEVWGEEHAHAFTVAKVTELELLATIKASLQRAIDEGRPYEAWAKDLRPELQRAGWLGEREVTNPATGEVRRTDLSSPRRLRTIYDANLRTARAAGQWERAQRTKAVLPYLVYELGPSVRHRPEHVAKQGVIRAVDDPFWDAWFPPNGWGCKCWTRSITRGERDRREGGTPLPEIIPTQRFQRRRDDDQVEVVDVPVGVDPGWATNPGRNRARTAMARFTETVAAAGEEAGKAAIAEFWKGPAGSLMHKLDVQPGRPTPDRFYAPAAIAPPAVREAMGAETPIVQTSSDLIGRKLGKRPMTTADFALVQEILERGRMADKGTGVSSDRVRNFVARFGRRLWQVVLVRALTGELFIKTLHEIDERKLKLLFQDGGVGLRMRDADGGS